jgi:hypothetical protein
VRWLTTLGADKLASVAKRLHKRIAQGAHKLAAFEYGPEALAWERSLDDAVLADDVAAADDVEPAVVRSVG